MREGVGCKKEAPGQVGGCVCETCPALCGREDLPSGSCHVLKEVFLTPTRENSSPTLPRMLSGGIALELTRAQLMKRLVRFMVQMRRVRSPSVPAAPSPPPTPLVPHLFNEPASDHSA